MPTFQRRKGETGTNIALEWLPETASVKDVQKSVEGEKRERGRGARRYSRRLRQEGRGRVWEDKTKIDEKSRGSDYGRERSP